MKKLFTAVFFIFIIGFLPAEWIRVSENSVFTHSSASISDIDVMFRLDGYEKELIIVEDKTFTKISYPEEGSFWQAGYPDLPRFSRFFAIPDEGDVFVEITYEKSDLIEEVCVYPLQEDLIESQPRTNIFSLDSSIYEGNAPFPSQYVQISEPLILRDVRLVQLTINPFQFDPNTSQLRVISEIDLSLRTVPNNTSNNKTRIAALSKTFEPIYRASIENYEDFRLRRDEYQNPSILFIYPNNNDVYNNLLSLINWKKQLGYQVTAASTSVTGTTTTSIKNYIQNAYNTWQNPPEFVTFVGDAGGSFNIPTFYTSGGEGDHPYSQLEGNDILADVILGRLSFETITEFQTILSKILNYEKTPFMGNTNWFNSAVMVGDPNSSGPSCIYTKQSIAQMMNWHAPNINITEVYSGNFANAMSSNINSGVAYFNYRGYYGMSGFSNTNIYALSNGNMLPFAAFLTCGTGGFASGTSRSEAFIRAGTPTSQKGAIAAIGTATSSTHTSMNNAVDLGIFYGLFANQVYNPGGALVMGKLHLFNSFPGDPSGNVTRFSAWNSLMGDPSVRLWTGTPQYLTVSYEDELNPGQNFLEISVESSFSNPVKNAWVTALSNDGSISVSEYTDDSGIAILPNLFSSATSITITVSGQNLYPHQGTINIVNSPIFLNITDYNIIDTSGNGLINPGENIQLQIGIHNFGSNMASAVSATITSSPESVTMISSYADFGNISAGSTQFNTTGLEFIVAENILGGTDLQFDFLIEDNSGNSWIDHLFLPVHAPNLSVQDYTIVDANGIFEPGETVELILTIFNSGTVNATAIQAQLSCYDNMISLIDSVAVFPLISTGAAANNNADSFQISADPAAINGSQIQFILSLSDISGFEQTISFFADLGVVTVNDPLGPDSYGYYAYDSGDVGYDLVPVYSWIEIDPSYGGAGTVLNLYDSGDSGAVIDVPMPFSFNFYGYNYNMITVCSNGWIAPGGASQASYMNTQIPGPHGPNPMIAAFWDDLKTTSGNVCYYHDTIQNIFIVEWSRVTTDWNNSQETFQIIIYDPLFYSTPTNDAEIVIQYHTVSNSSVGSYSGSYDHGQYATVGIEDQSSLIGLGYTYNNTYPTAAMPLQNQMAIRFTTIGGETQAPPHLNLSQNNFNFILQPGSSANQELQLTNTGEANLVYSISKIYQNQFDGRNQGGPDNYGYVWYDSNETGGPVYNWRDISAIGTPVSFVHNDEGTNLLPLGFNFNFYGNTYSQFRINPNGWIGFGADNTAWQNSALPDADAPRPAVMPFWDDLDPLQGGDVYYYGNADSLVVWFDDVIHYVGNYNGTYDFQVILYSNGEILFQYRDVTGDIDSATIGIQNADATDALQIIYNAVYAQNELAVKIKKIADWLDTSPSNGMILQNETASVQLSVDTSEMTIGQYFCDLFLSTNDPEAQNTVIPVQLTISSEFPLIDLSHSSLNFGTVLLNETSFATFSVTNLGNSTLIISEISSDLPEFYVEQNALELLPYQSSEIIVFFTPSDNIAYEAVLSLHSNDPLTPIAHIDLSGDALYPLIELNSDLFDFGAVEVNETVYDTLYIQNTGFDLLFIESLELQSEVFSISENNLTISPDSHHPVEIVFTPLDLVSYLDTLFILSNDPYFPLMTVVLTGVGEETVPVDNLIPSLTGIQQNYPNPFNPETTIRYALNKAGQVRISIFNVKGEKVRTLVNQFLEPGFYTTVWNGSDDNEKKVASGIYFYRYQTPDYEKINKMLLIK